MSEFEASTAGDILYCIDKGYVPQKLLIKTDTMIIDCETGFTQFKIPFEDEEAICWDCGKQRHILVYIHSFKSRVCHFSECCDL